MKLPFLRKAEHDEPLVVSMTGVRLGNRLLYIGKSLELFEPLAARAGLSGQTTVVTDDAESVRAAAERDGILIDAATAIPTDSSYDLVVAEARGEWSNAVRSALAAARPGGRLIVIVREARSWLGRLRGPSEPAPSDADVVAAVEAGGWTSARFVGGRDDVRFVESFKR
jgi:hypothetical protein